MIKKLHHTYRCRDSEETRHFCEGFPVLHLAGTLWINETKRDRRKDTLHALYELGDGSYPALFEAPDMPFEFNDQPDYNLHIALEVDPDLQKEMFDKGSERHANPERSRPRLHTLHLLPRPNGYIIELAAPMVA